MWRLSKLHSLHSTFRLKRNKKQILQVSPHNKLAAHVGHNNDLESNINTLIHIMHFTLQVEASSCLLCVSE